MTDKKFTDLTELTNPASTDVLAVVDLGTDVSKKVTLASLLKNASGGTAAAPGFAFDGDGNTGSFLIAPDQYGIATGGIQRVSVSSSGVAVAGVVNAESGTESAPAVTVGTTDNGLYSPGADQVAISTNGTERVEFGTSEVVFNDGGANYDFRIEGDTNSSLFFVDASTDRVGLGTSSPQAILHSRTALLTGASYRSNATLIAEASGNNEIQILSGNASYGQLRFGDGDSNYRGAIVYDHSSDSFGFVTAGANSAITINSAQRVGIGDTGPDSTLTIKAATSVVPLRVSGPSGEFARIDSSGRLLIGASSSLGLGFAFQVAGTVDATSSLSLHRYQANANGSVIELRKSRGATVGTDTLVASGDALGSVTFRGCDGSSYLVAAQIKTEVDGTPGANDMPGRLVFSTTPSASATPVERLRITSAGVLQIADAGDITTGTTTGTKIGTAATQKLAFWNATPIVQPSAIADITTTATSGALPTADGSVTIADATTPTVDELLEYCVELEAKLETALTALRNLGLIAT